MRAVGDDEHADRVGGLVDFGAQLPAAGQRRVDAVIVGVYPHLGVCFGLACPRTQPVINAHSGSSPGAPAAPGDSATRMSTP